MQLVHEWSLVNSQDFTGNEHQFTRMVSLTSLLNFCQKKKSKSQFQNQLQGMHKYDAVNMIR
jgi:hypothetical protein